MSKTETKVQTFTNPQKSTNCPFCNWTNRRGLYMRQGVVKSDDFCGHVVSVNDKTTQWVYEKEENEPFYRTIAVKEVNGSVFILQLQEDYDSNYEVCGYDYIISGPNWLSGRLKAQGLDEREIFEYWDQVTVQDIKDAWESYYEVGRC